MTQIFTKIPPPGSTRLCLDPWRKGFVRVNGDVCLCCFAPAVGNISTTPLGEVINNELAIAYRHGLLSGKLLPACTSCPEKPIATLDQEEAAVRKFLDRP